MRFRVATWMTVGAASFAFGCGGAVAEGATQDAGGSSHDAGTEAAVDASPICFPDQPGSTTSCPPGTLCNYAWGNGTSAFECTPIPAVCAVDRTCDCLVAHPPAPAGNQFCGGRYCYVTDAGALVVLCAPD